MIKLEKRLNQFSENSLCSSRPISVGTTVIAQIRRHFAFSDLTMEMANI